MTSKEALKNLYHEREKRYDVGHKHKNWATEIEAYDKVGDCLITISNDLENLEKLEQENQELKEKIKLYELWDEIKQDVVRSFEGICLHDFNIQYIENSKKYFGSEMAVVRGTTLRSLISENQKLEKAIEILKEKSLMKIVYSEEEKMWHFIGGYSLTNEEYELLKEVLCDVR